MIKKRETCIYCNEKMESKTAKKKFCSALHRLYFNREIKRGTLKVYPQSLTLEECINHKELVNDITINEVKDQKCAIQNLVKFDELGVTNSYILDTQKEDKIIHKNDENNKSKIMEEMERRVAEIQKKILKK